MSDDSGDEYLASDSSEDEILEVLLGIPRIKNENYLENTVPQYDEETFIVHFRIRREHAHNLAQQFERSDYYKKESGQYGKISSLNLILIFLWYIGHQTASFQDVADRFGISLSSLHRCITKVSVFISNLSPQIVRWPTENEKREIEQYYRDKGFPGVIGAIDGSHIKIDKPENDAESYINRKGYYSIQMQVVCDNNRVIRDIFVGYPGSVHDARVFRNSPLFNTLQEKCGHYFLLGDSAYPLKPNLMTPFKDRGQLTPRQINYNVQLSKNRYVIEHCFGIVKQKFRQLYHLKLRRIEYMIHFIRAACVLHNISINDDFEIENANDVIPLQIPLNINDEDEGELDIDVDARRIRDNIVHNL